MKGIKARHLLVITLVLGIVTFACPVLGQTALWPSYHYDMWRTGQNKAANDIKDPSTIKAVWAFPRIDAALADDSIYTVDDSDTTFSATGRWRIQDQVNDAIKNSYHYTPVVLDPKATNIATAVWPFPSVPKVGRYQVFVWLPNNGAATTAATYTVKDDNGSQTFTLNQQSQFDNWTLLTNSFFAFTPNSNEGVSLSALVTDGTAGGNTIVADAVKFVPVPSMEIYSSPASADIPVTLTDPDNPATIIWGPTDPPATCAYVGTVESGSPGSSPAGDDKGAIYCVYGITPTTQSPYIYDPIARKENPNPAVPNAANLVKISKYLGKYKWRYPKTGTDVNKRDKVEGPVSGGFYASPTLATIAGASGTGNQLVCFAAGMDHQVYALDAVTGDLLWKGPGITVGEEDDSNVVSSWQATTGREDAFGGQFHYNACVDAAGTPSTCTWNYAAADQSSVAPSGAEGLAYNIYVWIPEAGGTGDLKRTKVTYKITYYDAKANAILSTNVSVDQNDSSIWGTWYRLGLPYFNPTSVVLSNAITVPSGANASDYAAIADAVMFVPDTIDPMGYCTPITNADTFTHPTDALATSLFAVTQAGRIMSFNVATPGKKMAHLNWIYPAVRMKKQPKSTDVDQPSLGDMGASPAFDGPSDRLVVAGMDGRVTCLANVDSATPTKQWTFTSSDDASGTPSAFTSSPAIDGSHVYVASSGGYVYSLDLNAPADSKGNITPTWQYPAVPASSSDTPDNPLGAFRYSTPAVATPQDGIKRLWVGSSDGHIYSFNATTGERLFVDDTNTPHGNPTYNEPSFGLPIQGSVALDNTGKNGENIIMYVGDMGNNKGTLHWRDAVNGQIPGTVGGVVPAGVYEGWTAPGVLFSSPNITHIQVGSPGSGTTCSWIYVGCGDGHLIAFTDKNGGWGGEWQGGEWPFAGDRYEQNQQRSTGAPETDVQFDVFDEKFFNDTLNFDPEPPLATFDPTKWPDPTGSITNTIVSKEMKVSSVVDPYTIDVHLTDEAKKMRTMTNLAASRVTTTASDTVFYEWGEKIYCIVWNLPESKYLNGSSIADKVRARMTNESCGESAGSTSGGQSGNVDGLVMQVRALKDYTVLQKDTTTNPVSYKPCKDLYSQDVRRSFCLISIDINGAQPRPPAPGPGWTLYVDIDKRLDTSSSPPIVHESIPLAKLTGASGGYTVVMVGGQIREAQLGINNPLAIRDDGVQNDAPEGNVQIGWAGLNGGANPNRNAFDVHLNGNYQWVSNNGSNKTTQPYNYQRLPNPLIYLNQVVHGTSSREAPLGIMDRSAMGIAYRQIPKFRIDARDLMFRGDLQAIECAPLDPATGRAIINPPFKYGFHFDWDQGIGSIDYPNIYSRYQSYQLVSTDIDPVAKPTAMLPVVPTSAMNHQTSLVRPDTVLVSVDVPKYQPANESPDGIGSSGGYSRTMIAYVDSNGINGFDSGNTNRGRPTTWQEAYRTFRVELKVPPDPKILVDEQLIDIGRAPHGLGQELTGDLAFTAYNKNPLIQQWFKPITIKNAGNVNLYNIRLDQNLGLLGDQASPSQKLPGFAITSSLNVSPPPGPVLSAFGAAPFLTPSGTDASGGTKFLGYTLSKPRVGDTDPTVMTIPDRRKWENEYLSQGLEGMLKDTGWAPKTGDVQPLPVLVSVQVPLTQPIGTYQSWDPAYMTPYVYAFSDQSNATATKLITPTYGVDPMAVPSFQLKLAVRENQLTGGATPTTLPMIDFSTDGTAFPQDLPKFGDSTPAAYRDANNMVHLYYSSNRTDTPPTAAQLATFASAPWLINEAQLGYKGSSWVPFSSSGPTGAPPHWWLSAQKLPAFYWPPSDGTMPMVFSGSGTTAQYAVKHFAPSIAENLALNADAAKSRNWLVWAGTADFRDANNKIRQENLIFYTDITVPNSTSGSGSGGSGGGSTTPPAVFAIEHDPSQQKRYPSALVDGTDMWMFWQGGNAGNWSIYYSINNNGGPNFDTTTSTWSADQKLRTPDCLAAVGSPNPIGRHLWGDLRSASSTDFTNPFQSVYNNSTRAVDVIYAGTNKITRNSDIMLSRYVPNAGAANLPSRTAQPLPRVYNEKLARDPKLGFYTSQHIAWLRLKSGATPKLDDWGNYNASGLPYVRVFFPTDYNASLPAGSALSATDGSVWKNGALVTPGTPITPDIDASSGVYTYSYPANSLADAVLGKMIVDYSSGIIRFQHAFKETATVDSTTKTTSFSAPEVHADYTPQAWRITTDSAVDGSPRAFIERTSMTDPNSPGVTPGLDPDWKNGTPAPVDRLWVFWRKTGAAIENSTIFYTTMRVGIDLTKLGLPPIPVDPSTGKIQSWALNTGTPIVAGAFGPWEVDRTGTKIYFSEVDEFYKSALFDATSVQPGHHIHLHYKYSQGSSTPQDADVYDMSWITELPEQSLGFTMDANVNEGSIYAFADPQPQFSGTSVGIRSSKIWVFWTSTRGGNSDLFWETLSPNFWGR